MTTPAIPPSRARLLRPRRTPVLHLRGQPARGLSFRQHAQDPDGRDIIGQAPNGQLVREGVIPDAYGDVAGPSLPPGGTFASRIRDQAEHRGDMT